MTTKLDDKFSERTECRQVLLELRRERATKEGEREKLALELSDLDRRIKQEQLRLIEATAEVAKLLHSDLAGIMPSATSEAPPSIASIPGAH